MTTENIEKYFDRLWPICRSITGNGLRESFHILQEIIPFQITEVPSGTKAFDWEIPDEWNINDAFILTPDGKKICDFKLNNLHVVNYSESIDKEINFEELKQHLHYREDQPDVIPYVTSYYKKNWGFCISYNDFLKIPKTGTYKVKIDSTLKPGSLTYGDVILKGSTDQEILFSTYLCHPSMANNELSGPLCMAFLYQQLAAIKDRKYTYRFICAPETVGIIAYLSKHGQHLKKKLVAGYVLTCCGDNGNFNYKRSKIGSSMADRMAEHILKFSGKQYNVADFSIGGSDERQYCSPGFNLPVGSLMRTPYQQYKQYHTSADNKEFISFSAMTDTINMYLEICKAFELNNKYKSLNPFCEPQLGKRGLYPQTGGTWSVDIENTRKILHLLAFADGETDLVEIAEKRNLSLTSFEKEVKLCIEKKLIE